MEPTPIHELPPQDQAWYRKYVPGYFEDMPATVPKQARRASSPALNEFRQRPPLTDGSFRANASDPIGHYNPGGQEEEEDNYSERQHHQRLTANASEDDDSYKALEPRGHKHRLSQVLDGDDEQQEHEEEEDELDAFGHSDKRAEQFDNNEEQQGYVEGDGGYAEGIYA